ncbi:MAG TPA: hypothetical protein PLE45_11995 [Spirochaetota bacterium]|nr:hypothetical protein [Spirochaetota bacterium]HOL58040.1 hypothetical protein [Spirochaetota bacterium]HPP04377.1 hypothetical protein [Spirochaetota bacterium]
MRKNILLILIIFILTTKTFSIIIEDKINAKSKLVEVNKLINEKKYEEAISILNNIFEKLGDTEFASFVNYYLAIIEFNKKNYYKAFYFIESALNDNKFYLVSKENKIKMKLLYAMICYKLDMIDNAISYFKEVRDYSIVYKDEVNLYLSEIYFRKKDDKNSASYYFKYINVNKLSSDQQYLYYYLENFLLWSQIDTSNINYRDPNINSLLVDKDNLYIGLWNGGLILYNYILESYNVISLSQYTSEEIRALWRDNRRIYVGTTNGVAIIDKRNGSIKNEETLTNVSITSISGNDDTVYYGTIGKGLICKDKNDNQFFQIIDNENISALYYANSSLYIGTYNGNVYKYENDNLIKLTELSFLNKAITSFLLDGSNLWITTHGQGIVLYNTHKKKIKIYSTKTKEIGNDFILCSTIKDDRIYFGTLGNGIIFFDKNVNKFNNFKISDMYITNEIRSIQFSEEFMFIGTLGYGVLQKRLIIED